MFVINYKDMIVNLICLYIIPDCGVKPATTLTCCSRPAFISLCVLLEKMAN